MEKVNNRMSKSKALYKDSPTIEKNEEGKAAIKKPSKADGEDMGTAENDGEMPVQVQEMHNRHMTEMKDMHGRHEEEHKAMHKRHQKEVKKMHSGKDEAEEKKE